MTLSFLPELLMYYPGWWPHSMGSNVWKEDVPSDITHALATSSLDMLVHHIFVIASSLGLLLRRFFSALP